MLVKMENSSGEDREREGESGKKKRKEGRERGGEGEGAKRRNKERKEGREERGKEEREEGKIERQPCVFLGSGTEASLSSVLSLFGKIRWQVKSPALALLPCICWGWLVCPWPVPALCPSAQAPLGNSPLRRYSWAPSRGWGLGRNPSQAREHGQEGVSKADAAPLLLS